MAGNGDSPEFVQDVLSRCDFLLSWQKDKLRSVLACAFTKLEAGHEAELDEIQDETTDDRCVRVCADVAERFEKELRDCVDAILHNLTGSGLSALNALENWEVDRLISELGDAAEARLSEVE